MIIINGHKNATLQQDRHLSDWQGQDGNMWSRCGQLKLGQRFTVC